MSGIIEVSAKSTKEGAAPPATISYDFGENLAEMVDRFTDSVVHTNARANMKVVLQSAMRRRLEAGQDCESLTTDWKPGVQMERIHDPIAAAKAKYATMSDEDKAAFIASLQDM